MPNSAAATTRSKTENEIVVERDVMVAMRDGVRLATDIYRPARNGSAVAEKLPVILERTPYGKLQTSRSEVDAGMATPRLRPDVATSCAPQSWWG